MWFDQAKQALDELEVAHRAVGGRGPGRRFATLQVNHAYAVLLSSQFQRFCRDLHSEAVDALTMIVPNADLRDIFRAQLTTGRKLDSGNPNPGNIGSDFGRLGMDFWAQVQHADPRNAARRASLERLNRWRNAIAHQDFSPISPAGKTVLQVYEVRRWRAHCNALARKFDLAVGEHLTTILGKKPW